MNFSSLKSTFTSVSKALEESSTAARSGLSNIQSTVSAYDKLVCSDCNASVSNTQVTIGLATYEQCRICGRKFCGSCIFKDPTPIPSDLLVPEFQNKENVVSWLCKCCQTIANDRWMQDFRASFWSETELRLTQYLEKELQIIFFEIPKPSQDSYKRKVERFAQIAEAAADIAGYSVYFRAIKYAYYSKELYAMLIAGDIMNMLGPIVQQLDALGARSMGTKGVLQLYYLSCQHKLELKVDPTAEFETFINAAQTHVLSSDCPESLLDRIGKGLDLAQVLYMSSLPTPHNGQDWSAWYLSRLVRKQGWTVIACVNETTKLKNDRKCPAFALLTRKIGSIKEAAVVIRGSKSVMDWSINLNEDPKEFTYYSRVGLSRPITGLVHAGMLEGAKCILDDYFLRLALHRLFLELNYSIMFVGHSLGAGTAALLAAKFRNGVQSLSNSILAEPGCPKITALSIACPACVTENISDAIAADDLVLSVVNGFDIVPRFSKANMAKMLQEIRSNGDKVDDWYNRDLKDLKSYVYSMGKSGDAAAKVATDEEYVLEERLAATEAASSSSSSSSLSISKLSGTLFSKSTVEAKPVSSAGTTMSTAKVISVSSLPVDKPAMKASVITSTSGLEDGQTVTEPNEQDGILADPSVPAVPLVPVGRIVHLYNVHGEYRAAEITHRHVSLQRIMLLDDKSVGDHSIDGICMIIRRIKLRYVAERGMSKVVSNPVWQSIRTTQSDSPTKPQSTALVTAGSVQDSASGVAWTKCCVCDLDPQWLYILKGDVNRGRTVHTCRSCGQVTCTICSPSGDTINGDGISSKIVLNDLRLPLPFQGLYDPQRVCVQCYLESYRSLC